MSSGNVKLQYCPTNDMVADMFTKPLGREQFFKSKTKLELWRNPELHIKST